MVHWTGATNYPLSGDEVHRRVLARTAGALAHRAGGRTDRYRIDVLAGCGVPRA